jgi:hypothetical protein
MGFFIPAFRRGSLLLVFRCRTLSVIRDDFWLGISGEAGLEYRFKTAPIALGADWRANILDNRYNKLHVAVGSRFYARFVFGT